MSRLRCEAAGVCDLWPSPARCAVRNLERECSGKKPILAKHASESLIMWLFEYITLKPALILFVAASADDEDVSPELKMEREKLRRQQNNARER